LQFEAGRKNFPRDRRIGRQEGFNLDSGDFVSSNRWFVVYARKNCKGFSRLGIIASKRVAPSAVSRNFAKRLVREKFRVAFAADCALDVIVRIRRRFDKASVSEVSGALLQQLSGVQAKCGNFLSS
jgi:ribonuclease P protein component